MHPMHQIMLDQTNNPHPRKHRRAISKLRLQRLRLRKGLPVQRRLLDQLLDQLLVLLRGFWRRSICSDTRPISTLFRPLACIGIARVRRRTVRSCARPLGPLLFLACFRDIFLRRNGGFIYWTSFRRRRRALAALGYVFLGRRRRLIDRHLGRRRRSLATLVRVTLGGYRRWSLSTRRRSSGRCWGRVAHGLCV